MFIVSFLYSGIDPFKGEKIMSKRSELAVNKFSSGYNCAQAVFFSFCDDLNIDKDTALKIACGFGAGMGRNQEVCGAVTGGIMVLGVKYGRGEKDDISATENTYPKVREFMNKFKKNQGDFICRNLLGECKLTAEEGQKYFKENDLKNKVCIPCVKNAVEILEGM
jgi:C_GCAxxG_C_C family probable redox protein